MNLSAESIQKYLNWQRNPCGKEPLDLKALRREPTWLSDEPSLSVQFKGEPCPMDRKAALVNLEGAFCWRRDFPGKVRSYYEGPHPADPDSWVITIYGEGKRFRALPEPWNPMKSIV